MELNLKREAHEYFEQLQLSPISCETMREHIVPDSCADIARIVETTGQVFVTGKELNGDGRVCLSGTIAVAVLYIPERGVGVCALRFELPFQCCGEGQINGGGEFLDVVAEIQNIDTRLLNPRKVLTRVNLVFHPSVCKRITRSFCVDAQDDTAIELLRCNRQTRVIAAVREKEFTFVEELPISQGRGGAEELLSWRVDLERTDCKLIGSKLVAKGLALVSVLYRESGGSIEWVRNEFPFSQILDGTTLQEDWDAECGYTLLKGDCRIGSESGADDRHTFTITLFARARVNVWRNEEMHFIADLYSTQTDITCSTEEFKLIENWQRHAKRINVRESMETATAVKSILDTQVSCGKVHVDGDGQTVEIPLWCRCIYLDENDALHSSRKEFSVKCPTEQENGGKLEGSAVCRGDVMVSILPDGIELRFPVECVIDSGTVHNYVCVSGGEIEEAHREAPMPSLVLRRMGEGEKLWSIAKAYRTTCKSILEINEVADEQHLPTDRLILIPRSH